jgi:hypothetical protein
MTASAIEVMTASALKLMTASAMLMFAITNEVTKLTANVMQEL